MSFGIPVRNGLGIGLIPSTAVSTLRIGGRPALLLNFIGTTSLDSGVTFTRGTTATFVGSNGLIQTAAIDAPRFDHDPVTLAPKGLLIEEARTNLVLYSEQFDNAAWVKTRVTVSANATTAPDGTSAADKIAETSDSGFHFVNQTSVSAVTAVAHTASVYVKAAERTWCLLELGGTPFGCAVWFNLSNGTVGTQAGSPSSATITAAGNGWWRITMAKTATLVGTFTFGIYPTTGNNVASYTGTTGSGIFVYGAQLEAGTFATSYIPTTTLAVTRNADDVTMTGTNFSSWYNQSEGTFVTQFTPSTISGTRAIFDANDGTINESIRVQTVAADPFFVVTDGGVDQANIDAGTVAANTTYKIAGAYALNDFAASIVGGTVGTDTSGTLPTVTQLQIGNSAAGNRLNGCIGSISYYNTRLPNATLQVLTV